MPKSSFAVPNPLGQQQAKQLLDTFMPHVQEKFKDMIKDVEQSWAGDDLNFSFRTLGMSIKGVMHVAESEVRIDLDLPFAALMAKGKIESEFTAGLKKLLAPRS